MGDLDLVKLKDVMDILEHITEVTVNFWECKHTELSVLLDVLGEARLSILEKADLTIRTLSSISQRKILRFASKLRRLKMKMP